MKRSWKLVLLLPGMAKTRSMVTVKRAKKVSGEKFQLL